MNIRLTMVFRWLCVVLWMTMIWYFSDQPELRSEFPTVIDTILRKIAHMLEFFVLAYFLHNALRGHGVRRPAFFLITFFGSWCYAVIDEYHQTFVYGRSGSAVDVIVDFMGILLFVTMQKSYNQKHTKEDMV